MGSPSNLTPPLDMTEEEFIAQDETPLEEITPDEIARDITTIVDDIDKQERPTRDIMLRLWKYLELLWVGSGNYYWDHSIGNWRSITQADIASLADDVDLDPTLVNKVINLIRPYGESLAGVLTTGTPKVIYYPDDADNELDIMRTLRRRLQMITSCIFDSLKCLLRCGMEDLQQYIITHTRTRNMVYTRLIS